ncbi:hypothetical protein Tco_1277448 [Tanacetum coccineum]
MSRRYDYLFRHMKKSFIPRKDMDDILKAVEATSKAVVPKMVNETSNQNMKDNLTMVVTEGIKLEQEKSKADTASMVVDAMRKKHERTKAKLSLQVTNDVATNVPLQVDSFLRNYMNNNILHVHHTISANLLIPDHNDDDARPKGESSAKRQITSEYSTFTRGIDDDVVPSNEVSQELMAEISKKGMKSVPTVDDLK